jgi:hypothetical protein
MGRKVDFNVEPVALKDGPRGRDDKDTRQIGQRFIPVQRLLHQERGAAIQMREDGALPAQFKTET